ncbi:Non-heme chloroperoxidase [Raoultella planticola]|uniref:Non-heme chloroperoxidase n=1 Tax=Raoultella planticola TaxID=575 RepID=A0A485BMD2_RAOPL|nr:Non-heme chloroperoxidase [Raoultella planticola]
MTGFREQGHGTPLVLLHGISSGAASWHKQMALSGYRVLAWDMPGYGESPMLPVAQANAGDYADALARMLDHAGVEQAVVVGHSLGALVGQRLCGEISPPRALPGVSRCRTGVRPGGGGTAGKSLAQSPAANGVRSRAAGANPGGEAAASLCGGGRYRHRCRRNAQAAS